MPLTVDPTLDQFLSSRSLHLARLWTITRVDSTVYRFTDHDREIVIGANTWTPAGGVEGSADRLENALKEHSKTFRGLLSDGKISDEDLLAGLFDDAEVYEETVDWRYPWAGTILSRKYWVSKVKSDEEFHEIELSGPTRLMRSPVGDILSRNCRHKLGIYDATTDIGCHVDIVSLTISPVTVLGTADDNARLAILADSSPFSAEADGFFDEGEVTFLSGANTGVVREIKRWTLSTFRVDLKTETPYPIAAGDTFSIVRGCDGLRTTCRDDFGNLDDHLGEPFMPFTDETLAAPNP